MPNPLPDRPLLVISRNLPPVVGGMERLMHRLSAELCANTPCIVIGPRGCRAFLPPTIRVWELPHRPAVLFVGLAFLLTAGMVLFRPPGAVLAGNGLMSLAAWPAALRSIARVVLVHGLDIVADSALYQFICVPVIRASNRVIANSTNTARLAREHGVRPERLAIVTPGVDFPAMSSAPAAVATLDDGRPTLVAVGRLVRRKGIPEFIRRAMPAIVDQFPRVRLVVIGAEPSAALQRGESEAARIAAALADTGLQGHVQLAGFVDDATLAAWMSIARVHVFPVVDLPQDVEGFGLVALEAAAQGVPTVAFDAGGVRDAVVEGASGVLLPAGDYAGFAAAVLDVLASERDAWSVHCLEIAAANSWTRYASRVREEIHDASSRSRAAHGDPAA